MSLNYSIFHFQSISTEGYKTLEFDGTVSGEQPHGCGGYCFINATIKMKMKLGEKRHDRPMIIEISIANVYNREDQGPSGIFFFPNAAIKGMIIFSFRAIITFLLETSF